MLFIDFGTVPAILELVEHPDRKEAHGCSLGRLGKPRREAEVCLASCRDWTASHRCQIEDVEGLVKETY